LSVGSKPFSAAFLPHGVIINYYVTCQFFQRHQNDPNWVNFSELSAVRSKGEWFQLMLTCLLFAPGVDCKSSSGFDSPPPVLVSMYPIQTGHEQQRRRPRSCSKKGEDAVQTRRELTENWILCLFTFAACQQVGYLPKRGYDANAWSISPCLIYAHTYIHPHQT